MKMKRKAITCPHCGSSVMNTHYVCQYCGSELSGLNDYEGKGIEKSLASIQKRDFGWNGWLPLIINISGIIILYIIGWILEDKRYYLATRAMVVWTAFIPLWILFMTFIWEARWGTILSGVTLAIVMFAVHLLIMGGLRNWHFTDDHVGISSIIGGAYLISWLIGRIIHNYIRNRINKTS